MYNNLKESMKGVQKKKRKKEFAMIWESFNSKKKILLLL